jgi:excinuclease ABC subunit C
MRLIREHRPPYNVQHKRDRGFCFIKLTHEEAPRLLAVFEVRDDGGWYAGPFQEPQRVREVVREVADLLELRDCARKTPLRFADQLDLFGREQTPRCLRADVGRCLGPCAGRCTRSAYHARAAQARLFLDGDADTPLAILQARMTAAADRLHFEYAAELRNRAERIASAREELVSRRGAIDALTFVYEPDAPADERRVYVIHRGIVRAELPSPRTAEDREELVQRAHSILRRTPSAARVSTLQASEMLLLARWFRLRPQEARNVWQDSPTA